MKGGGRGPRLIDVIAQFLDVFSNIGSIGRLMRGTFYDYWRCSEVARASIDVLDGQTLKF